MKIGLITFHRALNYGAVLQCYALQRLLTDLGHDVTVIDYRQPYVEHSYRPIILSWLLKKLPFPGKLAKFLRRARELRRRHGVFGRFVARYLTLTSKCGSKSIPADFDAYIIGSDQLWGLHCTREFDPVYGGDFKRKPNSKLIGYGISSTTRSLSTIGATAVASALGRFDAFSFRERELSETVRDMTGVEVPTVLDPTLLADSELWRRLADDANVTERDYVLLYEVRPYADDPKALSQRATEVADALGVKVIDLSGAEVEVNLFVALFRNARAVVSSSFHATVFALLFERPFVTCVLNDGKDVRYVELLKSLGLSSALHDVNEPLSRLPSLDFDAAKKALQAKRADSLKFITDALA